MVLIVTPHQGYQTFKSTDLLNSFSCHYIISTLLQATHWDAYQVFKMSLKMEIIQSVLAAPFPVYLLSILFRTIVMHHVERKIRVGKLFKDYVFHPFMFPSSHQLPLNYRVFFVTSCKSKNNNNSNKLFIIKIYQITIDLYL